ncbi:PP2C family protein-serine/threonine phosphatase [Isoptericola rhizosphaerae]|uniref:PP2C family protein-serine/threonine phosphatase n=1 Tax=Isoptericola rhizosphaerae TaxID=3377837 RepID=UPI00383B4111
MTLALRYAARSDVGLVRQNNQDSAYAGPNLLVVADGMGGHAGGDIASSLAIAALAPLDETEHGPQEALADLERTVEQARQDLVHASEVDPDLAGMGTTVTALLRSGNTLAMAHLGDSRAYLLRDGALNQVTVDHTFVQHLVDTGRISPDEAETHPQRNVVMRVLGDFDVDLTPDMSVREARPGDRWLLCSDGLSGFVPLEQITQVLAECESPEEAADLLITLAMTAASTDNITVVVADVVDPDDVEASWVSTSTQVVGAAASEMSPELARPAPDAAEDASRRHDDDEDDEDDDARPAPKRRPWIGVLVILAVLGGLGYGAWWAYGWTQEQFYVGVADGQVAVYRGIPQSAGPLTLSQPVRLTGTPVDELPAYWSDRLDGTIRASSEAEALERAERLIDDALPTPTPSPSTSPSPESSGSPAPSSSPASGSSPAARDEGAEA